MFLLTFVLIIISMLGAYTQVYALEAARLLASQTSLAQSLVNWHTSAASIAANVIKPSSIATGGCSLTFTSNGTIPLCPISPNATNLGSTSGAIVTGTFRSPNGLIFPNIPPSSAANIFQWNSLAFVPAGGGLYVVTYVTPSTSPSGFVTTATYPTPTPINVTESDIFRQLRFLGIPNYSFGYISGGVLSAASITYQTGSVSTTIPMNYTVPSSIPDGSLGIISAPGQCGTC